LSVHTKTILQSAKEEMRNEMEDFKRQARVDLRRESAEIFENMEFIDKFKKFIAMHIEQEIRCQLSQQGLQEMIRNITSNVTEDVFKDIIESVITRVNDKMTKKLRHEHQVAKDLCYSINAEVKHTLMHSPISAESESYIKEKMLESIKVVTMGKLRKIEEFEKAKQLEEQ